MSSRTFSRFAPALVASLAFVAACSSNAGFGGPPPYPAGGQPTVNPAGAGPSSSGVPFAQESAEPTATPTTPLQVDSASSRLAFDASAGDPVKAPRLVEMTFALNNPGASPMPITSLSATADSNQPTKIPLAIQALPNQDTVETLVAIASPKDASKTKQLTLSFADPKGALLAQTTIDFPNNADISMAPLDKKRPAGGVTINDVAVTKVSAPGKGLHYDVTFSVSNASAAKSNIAFFTITPPKSDAVKAPIAIALPARTETAPFSVIVPYAGKALPQGTYSITASDGSAVVATGSGPLL